MLLSLWFRLLPLADVSTAFSNLATLVGGYLPGILTFIFVIAGYMYVTAIADPQNAILAKRGMGHAVVGTILIVLAGTIAVAFYTSITK
ncbi:hypothetical protein [Tengunoibacter tsumagoiensis]|uniref:Uncharacterized protein n=1 Tax=Tengunoibacter tsumagoiensis TaxID=2014871 RepID=A0A402A049_9CHLR|nr:hypothetical protein [Tengunoibacter tsumagoiensis]GCE12518.1 hypothetical protein KTT_23770 [Tengunoibacter tsumagoiensis]